METISKRTMLRRLRAEKMQKERCLHQRFLDKSEQAFFQTEIARLQGRINALSKGGNPNG